MAQSKTTSVYDGGIFCVLRITNRDAANTWVIGTVLELSACAPGEVKDALDFWKDGNGPCAAFTVLFVVNCGTVYGNEYLVGGVKLVQGDDRQELKGSSRGSFLVALESFEMQHVDYEQQMDPRLDSNEAATCGLAEAAFSA